MNQAVLIIQRAGQVVDETKHPAAKDGMEKMIVRLLDFTAKLNYNILKGQPGIVGGTSNFKGGDMGPAWRCLAGDAIGLVGAGGQMIRLRR